MATDAGRDLDLKTIFCHEISPVPLSLADTAKYLRPTNLEISYKSVYAVRQFQPHNLKLAP